MPESFTWVWVEECIYNLRVPESYWWAPEDSIRSSAPVVGPLKGPIYNSGTKLGSQNCRTAEPHWWPPRERYIIWDLVLSQSIIPSQNDSCHFLFTLRRLEFQSVVREEGAPYKVSWGSDTYIGKKWVCVLGKARAFLPPSTTPMDAMKKY